LAGEGAAGRELLFVNNVGAVEAGVDVAGAPATPLVAAGL